MGRGKQVFVLTDLHLRFTRTSASVMASCTRPDESDSLIDQETPLRLDYLATTARMQSELRTFLSTLMLSALNAAELEGRSEKGVERKVRARGRGMVLLWNHH